MENNNILIPIFGKTDGYKCLPIKNYPSLAFEKKPDTFKLFHKKVFYNIQIQIFSSGKESIVEFWEMDERVMHYFCICHHDMWNAYKEMVDVAYKCCLNLENRKIHNEKE